MYVYYYINMFISAVKFDDRSVMFFFVAGLQWPFKELQFLAEGCCLCYVTLNKWTDKRYYCTHNRLCVCVCARGPARH